MSPPQPRAVALLVYLFAYFFTTVIAAALIPSPSGHQLLSTFLHTDKVPSAAMTTLGSGLYWALLLLPLLIVPFAAQVSHHVVRLLPMRGAAIREVSLWIPIALATVLSAYCAYRLALAGGLSAAEFLDRSACYEAKITRRIELMHDLGNRYYSFAYSSLPVLGAYFLARGYLDRSRVAWFAFAILSVVIVWLDLAIIMKAPVLIYVLLVGLTLLLCGFGWIRSAAVTIPTFTLLFATLSTLQFCPLEAAAAAQARLTGQSAPAQSPVSPNAPSVPSATTQDPAFPPGTSSTTVDQGQAASWLDQTLPWGFAVLSSGWQQGVELLRNITFRMGAGYPFYIEHFSDAEQRCGLELPRALFGQQTKCFPPNVTFEKMWPAMFVTGQQPAPAHVAAYAEIGPLYSIFVMVVCGLIIGGLASVASVERSPLFVALGVAACIYAYYATQVSLIGTIVDSYGLIWLLFPLVIIAGAGWLTGRVSSRRPVIAG